MTKPISQEVAYQLGWTDDAPKPRAGGGYEAAERISRELAAWTPVVRSADADILPAKDMADARAIDITRNDAYVAAGASLHKDIVVGALYMLNAKPNVKLLGMDDAWATEFAEEVEGKFTLWAESHNNWIDASRHNTLTSFVRLAVGVYLHSGEVLLTSEWLRRNQRPYRTAFQMVELNRLCPPMNLAYDQRFMRGGVEIDSRGAPVAYHIRREMPGLSWLDPRSMEWARVRAYNSFGRPNVIHVMEQQRPGQNRGISQLVAAMKEMRTTKRFRDVTLQNAIVNASFAAAIESELPTQQVFESIGSGNVSDAILQYATDYLGAVSTYASDARNMQIDGAKIPHFYPGTKLNLTPMGTPGGVGTDFESSLLRYIAANLDVSYEELSRDYRETNYSSARAAMVSTWRAAGSRKKMVADRVATLMYRNWFEEALNAGEIESMKGRAVPNFYEGLNQEAILRCDWIGAARGMIDPLKETQASILAIKTGLTTYEDEIGRQGKDWRSVFAQRKREKDLIEELGIKPEEANAINAVSGDPREASEGEAEDPKGTEVEE